MFEMTAEQRIACHGRKIDNN